MKELNKTLIWLIGEKNVLHTIGIFLEFLKNDTRILQQEMFYLSEKLFKYDQDFD